MKFEEFYYFSTSIFLEGYMNTLKQFNKPIKYGPR